MPFTSALPRRHTAHTASSSASCPHYRLPSSLRQAELRRRRVQAEQAQRQLSLREPSEWRTQMQALVRARVEGEGEAKGEAQGKSGGGVGVGVTV